MRASITCADRVFFAGITADHLDGDITAQTRNALDILDTRLEAVGADRGALLTVHIWLKDMALFREMTAVWNGWIGRHGPPSRSCVSGGAIDTDALIQVVASAARPAPHGHAASIERFGLVRGPGRPTMCLALAYGNWFTVCTLASDCSQGVAGQTKQILAEFDRYLGEAGAAKSNILTIDIWLKHSADRSAVNDVLQSWLVPGQLPSSSWVRADMARPEMLIEIRITAAR